MKEPVDHILRPKLPWRTGEGAITECGYDAAKVPTVTRDAFFQRLMIEAHREEFDALIAGRVERREWLQKKAALAQRGPRRVQ